jgi:hypothetical protein
MTPALCKPFAVSCTVSKIFFLAIVVHLDALTKW